jgi:GNAT superfamily N-acetyltransferase
MELRFVPPEDPDFAMLTQLLDAYYIKLVGDVHLRYAPYNLPHLFAARMVAYEDGEAIACGCWKAIGEDTAEIKRIYVLPQHRRKGAASRIIAALETDIFAAGKHRSILETARTTADSEALYLSLGYREIDYYGSPAGADNCRCFEKFFS